MSKKLRNLSILISMLIMSPSAFSQGSLRYDEIYDAAQKLATSNLEAPELFDVAFVPHSHRSTEIILKFCEDNQNDLLVVNSYWYWFRCIEGSCNLYYQAYNPIYKSDNNTSGVDFPPLGLEKRYFNSKLNVLGALDLVREQAMFIPDEVVYQNGTFKFAGKLCVNAGASNENSIPNCWDNLLEAIVDIAAGKVTSLVERPAPVIDSGDPRLPF